MLLQPAVRAILAEAQKEVHDFFRPFHPNAIRQDEFGIVRILRHDPIKIAVIQGVDVLGDDRSSIGLPLALRHLEFVSVGYAAKSHARDYGYKLLHFLTYKLILSRIRDVSREPTISLCARILELGTPDALLLRRCPGSTLRDRVCMTAGTLVLEPVFEADLPPELYGVDVDASGRAAAVRHVNSKTRGDEQRIEAKQVLANCAPNVLARMLPNAERAKIEDAYGARPLSISLFSAHFGLSRPPAELGLDRFSLGVVPGWATTLNDQAAGARLLRRIRPARDALAGRPLCAQSCP